MSFLSPMSAKNYNGYNYELNILFKVFGTREHIYGDISMILSQINLQLPNKDIFSDFIFLLTQPAKELKFLPHKKYNSIIIADRIFLFFSFESIKKNITSVEEQTSIFRTIFLDNPFKCYFLLYFIFLTRKSIFLKIQQKYSFKISNSFYF